MSDLDIPLCNDCKEREVIPGEDQCWKCLGLPEPSMVWGDDINERVADFSRVGTEEWKDEFRANWDKVIRRI